MDLYNGFALESASYLQRSVRHGDMTYEANKKTNFYLPDIQTSIASQYNSCDSKIVTQKTNFERVMVDSMPYAYYNATPVLNNRNLTVLNEIQASRTSIHPHNTYKSDYAIIDY